MSLVKAKVKSVLLDYGIDNSSILVDHLEDFCFELGAFVQFKPLTGAEARIVAKDGKGIITINSNEKMIERIRFSIGHELGHFLLHCGEINEFNCSKRNMTSWFAQTAAEQKEIEANQFSIELLLSEALVAPIIKNNKANIETIETIASEFKMSLSSSAKRFAELSGEALAVVFYNKNGMTSFTMSKSFEAQKYFFQKGPLDKDSLAYDSVAGCHNPKQMSVAATAWLNVPNWLNEETVMEQTRYFPQFDMGFSLIWIKSPKLIRY